MKMLKKKLPKEITVANKPVKVKMSKDIYNKIKFLCSQIHKDEWSGIIFYTIKGSLHKGTSIITLEDILPLDKGMSVYTEFKADERFIEFIMDKQNQLGDKVLDWQQGLIHSHNNMGVFFSGTDSEELLESCANYSQYFSIICNNRMEFCAKVAQYVKLDKEINEAPYRGLDSKGKSIVLHRERVSVVRESALVYPCVVQEPKVIEKLDTIFLSYYDKMTSHVISNSTYQKSNQNSNISNWENDTWQQPHFKREKGEFFQKPFKTPLEKNTSPKKEDIVNEYLEFTHVSAYVKMDNEPVEECFAITEELLEEFNCDSIEVARDFVANMITYCKNENKNFVAFATEMVNFIEKNIVMGNVYAIQISATIDGTLKNIESKNLNKEKRYGRRKAKI